MPNFNDLYPSKYLKSSDIKGKGEPTVVIAALEVESISDSDRKPVLYFQGKEKGMVLNRTNADAISQFLGPNTEDWMGREITIYVTRVQGPNGMTDGLRVKAPIRRAAPQRGHVVEERPGRNGGPGYATSTMRDPDPIEEVTGRATRDDMDSEIPF